MGILGVIGLVIALGCFGIMSKTSRILLAVLLAFSLYYWYSISAVFHGGSGPEFYEMKTAMTLMSVNFGGFALATVLGITKRSSTSEEHYAQRKKAVFKFLFKWGTIYGLYNMAGSLLIDLILNEDGIGWFIMKLWGHYVFIALLLLWLVFRRGKKQRQPEVV